MADNCLPFGGGSVVQFHRCPATVMLLASQATHLNEFAITSSRQGGFMPRKTCLTPKETTTQNRDNALLFGSSEDSTMETRMCEMVFPNQTNHYGTLFGGHALELMDKSAFITASRFTRKAMVTASSEKVDFKTPVKTGHLVELVGRIEKVGRTSVTVSVDMVGENLLTGDRQLCARGKFVLVAVDPDNRPITL